MDHNKLWKILRDGNTGPPYLPLEKPVAGQEATVRTGHGTTNCSKIGKGICQSCILSPCLFNLYAEHIMRNVCLKELHAGIKVVRRNINNLRYWIISHSNSKKQRGTKQPLDEGEGGE